MNSSEIPFREEGQPPGQPGEPTCPPGAPSTEPVTRPDIVLTPLSRRPLNLTLQSRGSIQFEAKARALIQFVPSGACVLLDMATPVIFGRARLRRSRVVDLSDLKALQHGVSRWHCMLRRSKTALLLCDLGSTNGTYLNGWRLTPNQDYVVANGDRIILGTLHLSVFFQTT